ncbi:MAG: UvrD-helicase domain-containing protein, partial [Deinococcales bacterium]
LGERAPELLMALFGKRSLAPSLAAGDSPQERALLALFQAAYARYQGRLAGALVAPGEVERRALQALDVPQARSRVVARFPVALIDEFQDVNPVQGAFFERLEGAGVQVEVVGDPKQSIYGFRNADVEVFRRALDAAEARGEVLPPLTDSRRHAVAGVRGVGGQQAQAAHLLLEHGGRLPLPQHPEVGVEPEHRRRQPQGGDEEAVDGAQHGAVELATSPQEGGRVADRAEHPTQVGTARQDLVDAPADALAQLVRGRAGERHPGDAPQRPALVDELQVAQHQAGGLAGAGGGDPDPHRPRPSRQTSTMGQVRQWKPGLGPTSPCTKRSKAAAARWWRVAICRQR